MSSAFRVISIGTLSAHPLWNEGAPARTGHATTTLIESGSARIIVDPGLPPPALVARLAERTPLRADEITHVFLTSLTLEHLRGLALFEQATWLAHEPEREAATRGLDNELEHARENGDPDVVRHVQTHRELVERVRDADDRLAPGVDLFPLAGVTAGCCGLLLPQPAQTVLIAGDAIATVEHLEQAKVLPTAVDVEQAMDSFREAVEIADLIVPGRGEAIPNPARAHM